MNALLGNEAMLEMISSIVSGFLMATMFVLAVVTLGFLLVAINNAIHDYLEARGRKDTIQGNLVPAPR